MLERASACLELGGRQISRGSRRSLHTRRKLHANIGHRSPHEACTRVPSAIPDTTVDKDGSFKARPAWPSQRHQEDGLLDFLYPEKALAFAKTWSAPKRTSLDSKARHLQLRTIRRFSTVQNLPQYMEVGVDDSSTAHGKDGVLQSDKSSDIAQLEQMLREKKAGQQDLAWQLYCAIPKDEFGPETHTLRTQLLAYLDKDNRSVTPNRVIQVFNEQPLEYRQTSSYRFAIKAYTELRMVGPAIQLLQDIPRDRKHNYLFIGVDIILKHTVSDEQWDLSLRVFDIFLRRTPQLHGTRTTARVRRGDEIPELWRDIGNVKNLARKLKLFLKYVREFQHELNSTKRKKGTLDCFVLTFVPHVMDHVIANQNYNGAAFRKWVVKSKRFERLQELKIPVYTLYEHAIKRLMDYPPDFARSRRLARDLYRQYRELRIVQGRKDPNARPSDTLIMQLIFAHETRGTSLKQLYELYEDLRIFWPDRAPRPKVLNFLIATYAMSGRVEEVERLFQDLQSHHANYVDIYAISSLLFVHARRADVRETHAQFQRISEEFGLVPDLACWNILILAHVRADDLDGAISCFNDCLSQNLKPDMGTFGPLLDFCAKRGDLEAYEALCSKAQDCGLPVDNDARARAGFVQTYLNIGDAQTAEAIAQEMLRDWQDGKLRGDSLTHTWNLLIQHYSLRRDIARSRRCYRQMVENKIPLNVWTYGSLIRGLIEIKQTSAAYIILRSNMPRAGMLPLGFHYATVMTGFLRERQVDMAMHAYETMLKYNVAQTQSSRQASLQTLGTVDLAELKKRNARWAKNPTARLRTVEKALRRILVAGVGSDAASGEPRHSRLFDSAGYGVVPQAYYGQLISLYSAREAYGVISQLSKKAEEAASSAGSQSVPITLTVAMMEAQYKAGNYAEVAEGWKLARDTASKLTKTFHQAANDESFDDPSVPLTDLATTERFTESHISNNRKHILFMASRIYIRSLIAQNSSEKIQEAQQTVQNLLSNGFVVDNLTYNELIRALIPFNRVIDAFEICEVFLMPGFPGWRTLHPNYLRKDKHGHMFMDIRHYDIKKTSMIPRYETLVALARALREIKQDERSGIGYNEEMGAWMSEILEQRAPMTIRAIEAMPRTGDRMQGKYFVEGV